MLCRLLAACVVSSRPISRRRAGFFSKSVRPEAQPSFFFARRGYAKKSTRNNISPSLVEEPQSRDLLESSPPYDERAIPWKRNTKLKFRVTCRGIDGFTSRGSGIWTVEPKKPTYAPFFNREDVLLAMLEGHFKNVYQGEILKPQYAIQMMGPGSGKTRFITEWIMQAFANPWVIERFLREEVQQRKEFLNLMYWSAYKQHTIIATGSSWKYKATEADSSQLLKVTAKVIRDTILQRHSGQSINFMQKNITIDEAASSTNFGLNDDLVKLVKLFLSLADQTYEDPERLPYPEIGLPANTTCLFMSIDECQNFSEQVAGQNTTDLLYYLFRDVAKQYHGSLSESGVVPFWFAVGTNLPNRFFNLEGQQSQFTIIIPSLGTLLNLNYLAQLCCNYFGAKLPDNYPTSKKPRTTTSGNSLATMSETIAQAVVRNFLKTFGNPRAVQIFVRVANSRVKECLTVSMLKQRRINNLDEALGQELLAIFKPTRLAGGWKAIELLNLRAAFCYEMDYDKLIPGLKLAPKTLVSVGYLTVWRREEPSEEGLAKFFLTRPFFALSDSDLTKELKLLAYKGPSSTHWTPEPVSLASLVFEKDCADVLTPNDKGKLFEISVASSLYARYVLAQKKDVTLREIFPTKILPEALLDAKVVLNGVVRLAKKISPKLELASQAVLNAVIEHNVIAIDVGNSKFADVFLPVTVGSTSTIIGFQCKQYTDEPKIAKYLANMKPVINDYGLYYVGIAPKQHSNDKFIKKLSEAEKGRAFLVEASSVVSPLYLVGMSFLPSNHGSKSKTRKTRSKTAHPSTSAGEESPAN